MIPGPSFFGAVCVAFGAGSGALLRWVIGLYWPAQAGQLAWGTFAANALGCFLAGLLMGALTLRPDWPPEVRLLLMTGFLGGLTTFSAFSVEVLGAATQGRWGLAITTIVLHLIVSLVATAIAYFAVLAAAR